MRRPRTRMAADLRPGRVRLATICTTQGVGRGDPFLFFGRFRWTEQTSNGLKFVGDPLHVFWGFLQVDDLPQTDRKPVSSSNLRSVGYDRKDMVLEIEFRSGSVYQYFAVPLTIYEGLIRAPSKRRYFNQYILPRFPYQRVG